MLRDPLVSGLALAAAILRWLLFWKLPADPWSLGFLQSSWCSFVLGAHLPCVLQVELGQRPTVERGPPVTEEEWTRHVGPDGRLHNIPELKNRIFSGVSVSGYRLGWADSWPGGSPLIYLLHCTPRVSALACGGRLGSSFWGTLAGRVQLKSTKPMCGRKRE